MEEITTYDMNAARSRLKEAYAIVDQFRDIVESEIVGKQNVLPMTSRYEGLGSAMAFIGEALDLLRDPDSPAYAKPVIGVDATRDGIRAAYGACDAASRNVRPDSPLAEAAAYLKSCLYALLDLSFTAESQESIGKALEICEAGDSAIADVEAMDAATRDACYISPDAALLHERLPELKAVFDSLRPRKRPDSESAGKSEGGG